MDQWRVGERELDDRSDQASRPPGPRVEIVVVAFESWSLLRICLESIDRHGLSGEQIRVWVIDNGRDEITPREIAAEFPAVRYERQSWNSGFSCANNRALEHVRAPYVLLLNPDAELSQGALEQMLGVMDANPDVGLAGCRLVQSDGSFHQASKRSFPTARSAFTYLFSRRCDGYTAPDLDEDGQGDVDAVDGAFMLVRTQAAREIGNFDERFWMYGEGLDLCRRLKDGGWRVFYDGSVTTTHFKSLENWTVFDDLLILTRTAKAIVAGEGAY